jgi:hypothetical protein
MKVPFQGRYPLVNSDLDPPNVLLGEILYGEGKYRDKDFNALLIIFSAFCVGCSVNAPVK